MDDPCVTCDGKGGTITHDIEGDGEWAMRVVRLDPCPYCLAATFCPGCSAPIPAEQDPIANEDWTCEACGWCYDPDRFAADADDYWDD